MSPTLTCLALALAGVDLGYRPYPNSNSNGGGEFIIQVKPATLKAARPGEWLGLDVPAEAREYRPCHFSIVLGEENLPRVPAPPASPPPATAPLGPATPLVPGSPLVPAAATMPSLSPGGGPVRVPPPSADASPGREPADASPTYSLQQKSTVVHGGPFFKANSPFLPLTPAGSGDPKIKGLAPINVDGGSSAPIERPWLLMWLFVIALAASNVYVGWLFVDARQRYRGLLTKNFSMPLGQPAAEA